MKNILLPAALLFAISATAQVQLDWTKTYAGAENQLFQSIAADNSGNIWTTGTTGGFDNTGDVYLMKYSSSGIETGPIIFNSHYNNLDRPADIITDAQGNVYVAGKSNIDAGTADIFIVKYNSSGTLLWSKMFNTPNLTLSIDDVVAIALDPSGNIYLGGHVVKNEGFEYDFLTVKYNAAGEYQWHQLYNGPANGIDMITAIAVDPSGNVYVTGNSEGTLGKGHHKINTKYDYATIKYNTSGERQWIARYKGKAKVSSEKPEAIALDASGNVYVTGSTAIFNTSNSNCATIKYNNNGAQQWAAVFEGPAGANDFGKDIFIDPSGNILVAGTVTNTAGDADMMVIKYDPAGIQLWWSPNDTGTGYFDNTEKAGMDQQGNFYITGNSSKPGVTPNEIVTIKLTPAGTRAWVVRYSASAAGSESPMDMIVKSSSNLTAAFSNADIYITGTTNLNGTNSDALTLKYSQPIQSEAKK